MFKWVLPILLPIFCYADSQELLVGSLTYHYFSVGTGSAFANKLDDNGTFIVNPMLGYRNVIFDGPNDYYSWTIFGGENSIGDGMGGGTVSAGVGDKTLRLGFLAGAYLEDNTRFYDKGIMSYDAPVSSHLGFAPIVGLEVVYNIDLTPRTYFTINNIIAPWLYTASVGIGWRL